MQIEDTYVVKYLKAIVFPLDLLNVRELIPEEAAPQLCKNLNATVTECVPSDPMHDLIIQYYSVSVRHPPTHPHTHTHTEAAGPRASFEFVSNISLSSVTGARSASVFVCVCVCVWVGESGVSRRY